MESKSQKIIQIIEKILPIMAQEDAPAINFYRGFLNHMLEQLNKPHEVHKIAALILKAYAGGMGSFNDLSGIFKNGQWDPELSSKFNSLRDELFDACEDVIVEHRGGSLASDLQHDD